MALDLKNSPQFTHKTIGIPTTMNPFKLSKDHLKASKTNYLSHLHQAFKLGFILIYAGILSIIHSLFPFLFATSSAKKVTWIYVRVILDSANPEIKEFNEKELALRQARFANKPGLR